jgi:hypothetical protein
MNKIVLIAALNYYSYTLWVHPAAWLVHNPHTDTGEAAMRRRWQRSKGCCGVWARRGAARVSARGEPLQSLSAGQLLPRALGPQV